MYKTEKRPGPEMAENENVGNGCPLHKKCGGCQLQNMDYASQLRFKQGKVISLLGKFCHVEQIIGMDDPLHYRCKVQAAFGQGRKGTVSGVYQSSSHKIVPVDSCMIEDENADRIIVTIRKLADKFKIKPFVDEKMSGFLRHVLVRKGCFTGEIMVVIVTYKRDFPAGKAFVGELVRLHPEITTVVQNVNSRFTSLVLGTEQHVLYGNGYIEDTLLGCTFRISPASFYQINPVMTEKLYSEVIKCLAPTGRERVIDAYCGTGTIGLIASRHVGQVLGIELNGDAVRDAISNAKRNNIDNVRFAKADASDFITEMASEGETADALIMDPPRAGSDVRFMRSAVTLAPKRIVYVSCNPETLARDLGYFVKNGYDVKKIQPFDMFPHTSHVETVALLSGKS